MNKLSPCIAEAIGTFALIFVGIGAIKADPGTPRRRSRPWIDHRRHGLGNRRHLGRPPQPRRHLRLARWRQDRPQGRDQLLGLATHRRDTGQGSSAMDYSAAGLSSPAHHNSAVAPLRWPVS